MDTKLPTLLGYYSKSGRNYLTGISTLSILNGRMLLLTITRITLPRRTASLLLRPKRRDRRRISRHGVSTSTPYLMTPRICSHFYHACYVVMPLSYLYRCAVRDFSYGNRDVDEHSLQSGSSHLVFLV